MTCTYRFDFNLIFFSSGNLSSSAIASSIFFCKSSLIFINSLFLDYDAIITPSALSEPPLLKENSTGNPICCTIWTLCGLPCFNIPLLSGENGLPIGVQLVGKFEEDDRLIRTANYLQKYLTGEVSGQKTS